MKRLTKITVFILLICLNISLISFCASAAENNSDEMIGMVNSEIPYIQVEIKDSSLNESKVSAKLGSKPMELYSIVNENEVSTLTYFLFDNSYSMIDPSITPSGSFEELKKGVTELIRSRTDSKNHFGFYEIGDSDVNFIGKATDGDSADKLIEEINKLDGKKPATLLNKALNDAFSAVKKDRQNYSVIKFVLITDSDADWGNNSIDLSEVEKLFRYNQIPLYTVCSTSLKDSKTFKAFRSLSRESGGEAEIFNYAAKDDVQVLFRNLYTNMYTGSVATFISDEAADSNSKELVLNVNGVVYNETILLDRAANISAPIEAKVSVNENNSAFIISFTQEGFSSNLPLNELALQNTSYRIRRSGSDKNLVVSKVEKNADNSYTVFMKKDIYTDTYNFSFPGITDLSRNANEVSDLKNVSIQAKSKFWIVFPYLIALICVILVLLAFYLILLHLKKKKNVTKIRELFVTQVNETVEEKHFIQNVNRVAGGKVNLYFKTSSSPQRHISLNIVSSVIVGRSDMCEVCIDDMKMSRQHFAIEFTQGVYMISDLDSANGTYVNGVRVHSRQVLNSGDMITAGLTSIRIEF